MKAGLHFSDLRKDVRFLTTLLGDVIREQEGEALFRKIESIRRLAKDIRRNHRPALIARQKKLIGSLRLDEAYKIAQAFTVYFQLVNIAEEMQRVRRVRDYEKDPSRFQEMSIRKLFHDLHARRVPASKISRFLSGVDIGLVLTAHPTEAKRRTVLDHLLRIAGELAMLDRPDLTCLERESATAQIKETLEILWQTSEIRHRKVRVLDEVEQTLFYFQRTILDLLTEVDDKTAREFERYYGKGRYRPKPFIHFSSWVGSDRDGNPNVTGEVTRQTADRHQRLIFRSYLSVLESLIRKFSQSEHRVGTSLAFRKSLRRDERLLPRQARELRRYEASELYRKKFSFMHEKLFNTRNGKKPCYASSDDFLKDLTVVRDSLRAHKASLAASLDIHRLIRQVQIFGFHLAKLEFRDHSRKVRQAMEELNRSGRLSASSKDVLDQMDTIREIQDRKDPGLAGTYILSMTEQADDVLTLFSLAKKRGLIRLAGGKVAESRIAIVPLFETIGSLENAHDILDDLLAMPVYRSYVASLGNVQEIMLGYSDSSKDGGYVAANWKLYLAQKRLAETGARHGVKIRLFHGKGGTIDRGGGESHKAILAQPYAAHGGRIKITEQGEIVSQKYANAVIAQRNLEELVTAVVWTNLVAKRRLEKNRKMPAWETRMNILSELSYHHYRRLVFETPGFLEFYDQATPIQVLKMTRIGSRPASRSGRQTFAELRAIPWVFSWVQSRYILSAWFGTGYALKTFMEKDGSGGLGELREMYREWPFFRSLVHNLQISLAKTDLYIAEQYADLAKDTRLRRKIKNEIAAEFRRAESAVLKITGQKQLLDYHPVLKDSIQLRNPYVDPLNYLQVRFLRESRGRKKAAVRREIEKILLLTVNGIAFGMKSTG